MNLETVRAVSQMNVAACIPPNNTMGLKSLDCYSGFLENVKANFVFGVRSHSLGLQESALR